MSGRALRMGVAGLGRAFTIMVPTLANDPRITLVAGADPLSEGRALFAKQFGAKTYASIEELCDDPDVEVVYVSTPHQYHAEHVRLATAHGKHVLVEKPMAITIAECEAMIEAAKAANVVLIIGHSHSFNAPVLRTRALIESGTYGRPRMINALNFTDFLYRPRRPEELDTARGGGVMFSQAAHQIDIVRLMGGGRVKSVRAMTGAWDASRPTEGAYSALLTFEDGAFATATYSGYAHFDSDELTGWIGELGLAKDRSRYGAARKALVGASDEPALKAARNFGGKDYAPAPIAPAGTRLHQHFGFMVVSCERADLRPQPDGVMIYDDMSTHLDSVPVPDVPRSEVIDELYAAIVEGLPPLHDGAWSLATLEVCLAILTSAREQKEIMLTHQVSVPREQPPRGQSQ
jgi:phthalate 4,5-cis-dihydrodiol dehydrogenase